MEATEKKATPINDFYDYLFSIEREMEAVEDAQKRLAIANQELKNTKDKAVALYHAAWEAAREAAREAGQEIPDSIICGTTLVRIDDEGGISVDRVEAVDRYRLLSISRAAGEVQEQG
ncbi:hypothetical protein [Pseudomonas aeruginosa]|uniref:hypothetical protein n=1 Tax=Pseudomonas aeruginosa TaxID=287 RepID=UPI001067CD0B|nr:hypothetical protein [Pseudomonas aeruginosa]TEL41808.1 hypothetical protein IPC182_14670 [Pseudomonas aeruginosa]TEN01751.1 hypothetical protein IPC148_12525 [Pseudomonas aeruginosa]TEN18713.1 hypothetical protein IPC147_10420 [Pseudomonas aeruginosa]TEN39913.1 hypothetical protein IPC144_05880 [Pseudomonas aeruginosa]TEP22362.1 hypothetical protein IPC111_11230 [Pseudomonas aeruginosa]